MNVAEDIVGGATPGKDRIPGAGLRIENACSGAHEAGAGRLVGQWATLANRDAADARGERAPGPFAASSGRAQADSGTGNTSGPDSAAGDPSSEPALLQAFLRGDLGRAYALLDSGTVGSEAPPRRSWIRHRHGMSLSRDEYHEF